MSKLNDFVNSEVYEAGKPSAPTRPTFVNRSEWNWVAFGCPDCGESGIYEGPEGGACQNICCASCFSAFNVMPFTAVSRVGMWTERIESEWAKSVKEQICQSK